jgi:aspartyl/asparaginyl beta-hydroxylase (cupin superfamily)
MSTDVMDNVAVDERVPLTKQLMMATLYLTGKCLNAFFDRYTGGENRPVFFDIEKTCPELLEIDKNYETIRRELESILITKQNIPRYHEVDRFQYAISGNAEGEKDWKIFMLYAMGMLPEKNRKRCPETCALLERVPNLFQAFFSILSPGKSVPAHNGPYRGYLRYHLGLKVPANKPPTIRIKDQYHTWEEGRSVLFDDSWNHEVRNESDDIRVVLIVDILRPMPPFPHKVNLAYQRLVRAWYAKRILTNVH